MKEKIKKIIEKSIKGFAKEMPDFSVEIPGDKNYGDYSTNVALVLVKRINKNPIETANLIKEKVEKSFGTAQDENKLFSKIEVVGPGFINFFIADKFFIDNLKKIDDNFGKRNELKNKKII